MEYFCENPKCKNHIACQVGARYPDFSVRIPEDSECIPAFDITIERRVIYLQSSNGDSYQKNYFCDVCYEVYEMLCKTQRILAEKSIKNDKQKKDTSRPPFGNEFAIEIGNLNDL